MAKDGASAAARGAIGCAVRVALAGAEIVGATNCFVASGNIEIKGATIAELVGLPAIGEALRGAVGVALVGAVVVRAAGRGVAATHVVVVLPTRAVAVATRVAVGSAGRVTLVGTVIEGTLRSGVAALHVRVVVSATVEIDSPHNCLDAAVARARQLILPGENHIAGTGCRVARVERA